MIKSLNYANNVEQTSFILFQSTSAEAVMLCQLQMAADALERANVLDWKLAYNKIAFIIRTGG